VTRPTLSCSVSDLQGECHPSAITEKTDDDCRSYTRPIELIEHLRCHPLPAGDARIAERDPRFQRAVWMNSKCGGDTSFKTLHLFLKIKVMRPPAEPTAERRQLLRVRNFASPYEKAGVRQHVTLSAAINCSQRAHNYECCDLNKWQRKGSADLVFFCKCSKQTVHYPA
jgi:hypothetical protein